MESIDFIGINDISADMISELCLDSEGEDTNLEDLSILDPSWEAEIQEEMKYAENVSPTDYDSLLADFHIEEDLNSETVGSIEEDLYLYSGIVKEEEDNNNFNINNVKNDILDHSEETILDIHVNCFDEKFKEMNNVASQEEQIVIGLVDLNITFQKDPLKEEICASDNINKENLLAPNVKFRNDESPREFTVKNEKSTTMTPPKPLRACPSKIRSTNTLPPKTSFPTTQLSNFCLPVHETCKKKTSKVKPRNIGQSKMQPSQTAMPNSNNKNNNINKNNISRKADILFAPIVEPRYQYLSKTQLSSQGYRSRSGTEEYSSIKAIIDGAKIMFQCPDCERTYDKMHKLKAHRRVHSTERNYTCMYCSKSFRMRSDLIRHISMHTGEKKFRCGYCDKAFRLKWDLQTHMTLHTGEKNYKCKMCEKTCRKSSDLTKHMKVHSKDRDFNCSSCEKTFKCRSTLKSHLAIHINKDVMHFVGQKSNADATLKRKPRGPVKRYECAICKRSWCKKDRILSHMSSHSEESYVS